jgi:DNA invertase Pin-like site-specific DNA recombinase
MAMMRKPVAYVRRSTADAGNPGDVSRDVQEAAVRALAHRDGHNGDVTWYTDWARSADEEKEARRTEFRAMLAAVEAGRVSVIYAYSLDRLARSTVTFGKLLKAAKDQDVRIVTEREGDLSDDGNPMRWAYGFLASFFAEFELRIAKARAQSVLARRRARGDKLGPAYYGDLPGEDRAAVVAAFERVGSVQGAARYLNETMDSDPKAPRPRRAGSWTYATVHQVLAREGRVYRHGVRGARLRGRFRLSQLLRCHCGRTLSGVWHGPKGKPKTIIYRCVATQADPRHGKASVAEARILPWVMAEAGRWTAPGDYAQVAEDTDARRAELTEQRRRLAVTYSRGALDDATYAAEDEALTAELADLDAQGAEREIVPIDWTWDAADINAILREMWTSVQLDDDLLPVRAEWRVQVEDAA